MTGAARPVEAADVPALTALDAICFPDGVAYDAAYFHRLVDSPEVRGLLIEGPSEPLAAFALWTRWEGGVGHVITIDVHPDHRKQGLGRFLMDALEDDCRDAFVLAVILEVSVTNAVARAFYRRLGYRAIADLPDYYGAGKHAYLMQKTL